jgi:hypothetical protein
MIVKKGQLYESIKQNGEQYIYKLLDAKSLLNLALCNKKYYLLITNELII